MHLAERLQKHLPTLAPSAVASEEHLASRHKGTTTFLLLPLQCLCGLASSLAAVWHLHSSWCVKAWTAGKYFWSSSAFCPAAEWPQSYSDSAPGHLLLIPGLPLLLQAISITCQLVMPLIHGLLPLQQVLVWRSPRQGASCKATGACTLDTALLLHLSLLASEA